MGDNIVGNSLDITVRTARWRGSSPPTLSDSSILPATRVRLATVAARYSWNRVLTLPT